MPHYARRFPYDFGSPKFLAISKSVRTSLKCRKMFAASLFDPSAVCGVRRIPEPSRQRVESQFACNRHRATVQAVHAVFPCRCAKSMERLLAAAMPSVSISSAMVTLPIPVLWSGHQVTPRFHGV